MHSELVHREQPSPNWDERALPVTMVVLHYTEMACDAALARLCDPEAKVSAHYFISEAGEVVRLVDEAKRAWHAGASYWRGHKDVNSASVGIELDNPGHALGYREFPEAQIEALIPLLHDIVRRHDIPRANVVGHSDVAPARKIDPGELFPWGALALAGIGLWPQTRKHALKVPFEAGLRAFGYGLRPDVDVRTETVIEAFQRHFRPARIDGVADIECERILAALLAEIDLGH